MITWHGRRDPPGQIVAVVLTRDPAQWAEACAVWREHGVEWCICSDVYGIGAGAGGVLRSILEDDDSLPVLLLDDTAMDLLADGDTTPEVMLSACPVPIVYVAEGTLTRPVSETVARYRRIQALGWGSRYEVMIDPDPMDVIMVAAGWWVREGQMRDEMNMENPTKEAEHG